MIALQQARIAAAKKQAMITIDVDTQTKASHANVSQLNLTAEGFVNRREPRCTPKVYAQGSKEEVVLSLLPAQVLQQVLLPLR